MTISVNVTEVHSANVLSVRDNFYRIVSTMKDVSDTGSVEIDFECLLPIQRALKLGCQKVIITVLDREVSRPTISNRIGDSSLIAQILRSQRGASSAQQSYVETIVCQSVIDITSKANNADLPAITSDKPYMRSSIALCIANVGSLIKQFDVRPVLNYVSFFGSNERVTDSQKKLAFKMITKYGVSPTQVVDLTTREMTPRQAFDGTLRPMSSRRDLDTRDPLVQLLNSHVFDESVNPAQDSSQISTQRTQVIIGSVSSNSTRFTARCVLPNILAGGSALNYFVKFDLVRSDGLFVDEIKKTLNLSQVFALLNIVATKPPLVSVSNTASQTFLHVKQVDENADGVIVYRKSIRSYDIDEGYVQVYASDLTSGNTSVFQINTPLYAADIYRVASTMRGVPSYDFSDCVVRAKRGSSYVPTVLIASMSENGLQLESRFLSPDASSVVFKYSDITVRGDWVTSHHQRVTPDVLIADHLTWTFMSLTEHHVYKCAVDVYDERGTVSTIIGGLVEYVVPTAGSVSTSVTGLRVIDNPQLDVTFNVSSSVTYSNVDAVRVLVDAQLPGFYNIDVQKQKTQLAGLIAHSVTRVNQHTGDREYMGLVLDGVFVDSASSSLMSAEPLKSGSSYIYEISVILQTPQSMLSGFTQQEVDPMSRKIYSFSPLKFLNPATLREGTLMTESGITQKHPGGILELSNLGVSETVSVSLENSRTDIQSVSIAVIGYTVQLKCMTNLSQRDIDHYLVFKQIHGAKSLIGKCQPKVGTYSVTFLYDASREFGELSMSVTPVYMDYVVGVSVESNILSVGDF